MNTITRVLPLPAFGWGRCSPTERQRLIYVLLTNAGFFFYNKLVARILRKLELSAKLDIQTQTASD